MDYLHFLPNQSMKEREDGGGEPSRSRFLGRPRLQGHEVLSIIPGVHVGPEDRKGAHGVPLEPLLQEAKVELVRPLELGQRGLSEKTLIWRAHVNIASRCST